MSDWTQRLQRLQKDLPPPALESLEHFSLENLMNEKVSFGKAHNGKTFEEVWNMAPEWTQWFLNHYEQSRNTEHRKMIKFIKMKIESMEQGEQTQQMPSHPRPKPAPKALAAKSKAMPMPSHVSTMETNMPWMEDDVVTQRLDQFQERMGNLENALHQILVHLTPQVPTSASETMTLPVIPLVSEIDDPWNTLDEEDVVNN